ncbi:hypothetical protein SMMN14_08231 [Sphaerulina musiva]
MTTGVDDGSIYHLEVTRLEKQPRQLRFFYLLRCCYSTSATASPGLTGSVTDITVDDVAGDMTSKIGTP